MPINGVEIKYSSQEYSGANALPLIVMNCHQHPLLFSERSVVDMQKNNGLTSIINDN